jgi:hypothetical protein
MKRGPRKKRQAILLLTLNVSCERVIDKRVFASRPPG